MAVSTWRLQIVDYTRYRRYVKCELAGSSHKSFAASIVMWACDIHKTMDDWVEYWTILVQEMMVTRLIQRIRRRRTTTTLTTTVTMATYWITLSLSWIVPATSRWPRTGGSRASNRRPFCASPTEPSSLCWPSRPLQQRTAAVTSAARPIWKRSTSRSTSWTVSTAL